MKKLTVKEKKEKSAKEFADRLLPYMKMKEQEPVKMNRAELNESIKNKALILQGSLDSFVYGHNFPDELIENFIERSYELIELLSGKPIKERVKNTMEAISYIDFIGIVNGLTLDERNIFDIMVMCKTKDAIYQNAFNGDPYDRIIWKIVHSLERKKLVKIIRNDYDKVIKFETVIIENDNENKTDFSIVETDSHDIEEIPF